MTNSVDRIYFKELSEKNPEDICRRTSCRYDYEKRGYTLSVWGDEYAIYPHEYKIIRITKNFQAPHDFLFLFIIYYLLRSKEIPISHEWISEKDIPGGVTFFRGPHEIPTHIISSRYKNNISDFKKRCEQLQGIPLDMADAAYYFKITSQIPVAVLYWAGDDDFPPESKTLYDKTINEHLTLDIVFALAVAVCTKIGSP
jgi:hypothetical protein